MRRSLVVTAVAIVAGLMVVSCGRGKDLHIGTWEHVLDEEKGEGTLTVTMEKDGSWSMKFQVTKAGPNPEFTLEEGPTPL